MRKTMKKLTQGATRLLALALGLGLAATGLADTLRVLGDDVAIHSNATDSNRSGYAITTGSLSFNTPSGCSAGDALLFTKLQMINEGSMNNYTYAQTITITVGDKTYTSGKVVGPANESIGNLGTKSVLTYNFPNVPVQAGSSYAITFNNAGSAGIRYGVENTNTYTGYTISLTGSSDNWHPYGAITATKVLSSSPDVGDKILLSNTATSGTISDSGAAECNINLTIPTNLGLPANSVVRIKKVNLASWNDSYTAFDETDNKSDPYFIKINNIRSLNLQGSSATTSTQPTIDLTTSKIQGNGTTFFNCLSFAYSDDCDLTVGTTYPAATGNSDSTGVAFLHCNGKLCYGNNTDRAGVRYVDADSESILSSAAATGAYPIYELYAEVISIPTETATISAAGTHTLAGLFTSVSSSGRYTINVNESATLNIDAATTVKTITFNVAADKTLTLTGSSTLSASIINVNGDGMVVTSSGSSLAGTLRGDGTVAYSAAPTGLTLNDAAWEGVLWLKNVEIVGLVPGNVTSANSTLRLTGCTGYFNNSGTASNNPQSTDGTLDLQDDGSTKAFTVSNGWSDDGITVFGKLTGTGTLACSTGNISQRYVFKNAAQFTGAINAERTDSAGAYYLRVILGDGASLAPRSGTITVASGATASVAAGKTWNAWAINVNGTLNVGNGSTISAINTGSTGMVMAYGSGSATVSGVKDGAISANLAMVGMNLAVLDTSITELTIPADTALETQTFAAQNGGKLDLSACTSLTTLKLNLGSSTTFDLGNVILPASCTTVKYVVAAGSLRDLSGYTAPTGLGSLTWDFPMTETREEYAKGTFSVANVPANATVTVTRYNGTSATATVTDGTARLSDYGEPKVSGDACWHAYEFNSTYTSSNVHYYPDSVSTDQRDCRTWDYADPDLYTDPDKTDNKFIYTIICPGPNKAYDYPTEWSAAIRCTTPSTANSIIVAFGNSNAGNYIALVSGDTAGKVRLVSGSGSNPVGEITSMTVANPTTSQHVYVFTKTASAVTVYCDGDLIVTKPLSLTIGSGFQFGTIYGGTQNGCGLSRVSSRETAGMVDYTRLYDFAISSDMIQKLAADDQYESSTPTYSREVSGSPWWHTGEGTWLKSDDSTLVGVPDVAGIVDLTATADATITVNLPAAPVYEKLTFQGAGAVTLVKNGNSPKIATAKLVVKTNVTAPYDIADFSGARISVDAGKVLTFDFSTYPLENVTGVTTQQVTGVTTRADDRYAVAASTKPAWNSNLSLVYDPVEYVYSVVIDPAALVTKNNTTVAYPTVAAALTALSTDAGTVRLLVNYDQDITLSAGQTLDVGSTTYSGTASATGQYAELVHSGTTWKAVDNSVNTWKSSVTTGEWNVATNWVNGVKPKSYTRVIFPENVDGYTVYLRLCGESTETQNDKAPVCAGMVVDAQVDMVRDPLDSAAWGYIFIYGDVSGKDTLALHKVGLYSRRGSSVTNTVSCNLSVVIHSNTGDDSTVRGGPFVFDGAVTVTTNSELRVLECAAVFNELVTIENGAKANGIDTGTALFNGGISVPADAAATLVGGNRVTIASTVTLASGATLTVPNATTVSDATFATPVADSYVKATAGESTTVYSVAAKRAATVSVGTNAALSINGNAVADGDTLKFVPDDVLTITASADTYYTPALTVNGVAQTSPYELTTTDADVTVSVTATLDTYTITIPVVANTTVSVSYTSGGAAQVATTAGDITVDAGTDVTANWTAASGYKITSGASQTLNAVTSAQTLASPTVEAMGATVSDVNFSYGADYATATVTATVTGDATSATLSYGNATYNTNVVNGTVTFENVAVTRGSDIYAPAGYTITAKDGETAVTTTGGSGTSVAADVVAVGWINENAETSGTSAGGSWTNAVTYANGKAEISDNRFEATTASTASRVVLEFNVCFSSASDADVEGEAQAAIKLGESGGATTFMVLASNAAWTPVSRGDFVPDASTTYKVVMTIDYGNGSYGVTVGDNVLTNASGSASFPLAKSGATSVKNIDFAGSGTLTSMKGDQVEGYMVKDNAGNWYATIQAATQAYNSANGPYTVLHDGTAPSGWKIDETTKALIKLAKGFFFMAY